LVFFWFKTTVFWLFYVQQVHFKPKRQWIYPQKSTQILLQYLIGGYFNKKIKVPFF